MLIYNLKLRFVQSLQMNTLLCQTRQSNEIQQLTHSPALYAILLTIYLLYAFAFDLLNNHNIFNHAENTYKPFYIIVFVRVHNFEKV